MDLNKQKIIDIYRSHVVGKKYNSAGYNKRHCGAEGHWLESKMGIVPNASNTPDILGYEMKKDTKSKTSFGDWDADIALWKKNKPYQAIPRLDRDSEFLKYFGKPNVKKDGRLSWSGEPSPKIKQYNLFGQILSVDASKNILAYYSFSRDSRPNKSELIPVNLQQENLILAQWTNILMQQRLERKFNNKGWFKCYKDSDGIYSSIGFGEPINYNSWINLVKSGVIYLDLGMYATNKRPYMTWRANNTYWDSMVIETY